MLTPSVTERIIEKTTVLNKATIAPRNDENEIIKIVRLTTVKPNESDMGEVPPVTDLIEQIDRELEEHLSRKTNEITERIVKEKQQPSLRLIWVVVGVIATVVVVLATAILIIRKRSYLFVRGMRCSGASGDSQSDVRFLTSDEVLDFRLARSDVSD